eukprot:10668017-Alexandrium_andersonii.AAC.1
MGEINTYWWRGPLGMEVAGEDVELVEGVGAARPAVEANGEDNLGLSEGATAVENAIETAGE